MSNFAVSLSNPLQAEAQATGQLAMARTLAAQLPSSSSSSTTASPRLVTAAHEFEASMMKELLAPLESGKDLLGGEDNSDDSTAALTEFASEALGKAISEHGGLGIAKRILHQLTASHRSPSTGVTAIGGPTAPNSSYK